MKKDIVFTLTVLIISIFGLSCSDDDVTRNPKASLPPHDNEIKMVFIASAANATASFYISGDKFSIDWGDGKTATSVDVDEKLFISHQYKSNKEYVITITADKKLGYFKNFSANDLFNFKEENIPTFESIAIGKSVNINNLYIQASGVKKINFADNASNEFRDANVLLNTADWDLSMLKVDRLSIYVKKRDALDIKNLSVTRLAITVGDEINNLSVSYCNNLLYLDVSAFLQKAATVNNMTISNLPKLDDFRSYGIKGNVTTLSNLSAFKQLWLSGFNYEQLDMSKVNTSQNMLFKATGIIVSKTLKLASQIEALDISNALQELDVDLTTLDLNLCGRLKTVKLDYINNLVDLKFGGNNTLLTDVTLSNLPKMKVLDFSLCENLQNLRTQEMPDLKIVKFSDKNELLRNIEFYNAYFSEADCLEILNSLPNTGIPNIPEVNRRRFGLHDNVVDLSGSVAIKDAMILRRMHWWFSIN